MPTAAPLVLAAPDKFRGSLTAAEAAAAIAAGAERLGLRCRMLPLADGGEGTLDALGGANRTTTVCGPLGRPVEAGWRLDGMRAVVEAARASGLTLAGGRDANDPVGATTRGTGELIAAAIAAGATEILVGVGGSATTDGGLGAVQALLHLPPLDELGVTLRVACDVETAFLDAAAVFAPQKGADADQVAELTRRLHDVADDYRRELGVDVTRLARAGAAGGLAGGLAARGALLCDGFATIADAAGFDEALASAAVVVTGEGFLDRTSFAGKVVGGVLDRARAAGVDAAVVAGDASPDHGAQVEVVSLLDRFGAERAWNDAGGCVADAVEALLRERPETSNQA